MLHRVVQFVSILLILSAVAWADLKSQCFDSGDMQACYMLGKAHINGDGVIKDSGLAKMYLDVACQEKLEKACLLLKKISSVQSESALSEEIETPQASSPIQNRSYENDRTLIKLSEKDISHKEYQCLQEGNFDVCFELGLVFLEGDGVKADTKNAIKLFQSSCDAGENRACGMAAYVLRFEDTVDAKKQSYQYAQKACQKHEAVGCYILDILTRDKDLYGTATSGKRKISNKTMTLLKSQCTKKNMAGRNRYAAIKYQGIACDLLSQIYMEESDPSHSTQLGIKYLKKACALLNPDACVGLGVYYENGIYVEKDIQRAAEAYATACSYQNRYALECRTLAEWYLKGKEGAVRRDMAKARYYYRRACYMQGDREACKRLKSLGKHKTREKRKQEILSIIRNGSDGHRSSFGSMPSGMASGKDAEEVAAYVAGGMRGEKPPAFMVCAGCHGLYGEGIPGVAPKLEMEE